MGLFLSPESSTIVAVSLGVVVFVTKARREMTGSFDSLSVLAVANHQ